MKKNITADISLNREELREVKGYDKKKMESYLQAVYAAGERAINEELMNGAYEDGASAQGQFMLDALGTTLKAKFGLNDDQVQGFMESFSDNMTALRNSEVNPSEEQH